MKLLFATLLLLAVASAQVLRGVNYGIQRPTGDCTTYDEVLNDFKLMATFAQAVKIYNLGFCNGGQNALQAAQATGLKVFLGMAAGPDSAYQNEKRLVTSLYNSYGFSNVIGITVGSEDLYRNSVSAATIGGQITEVKNILKSLGGSAASVPVTHTDVYYLQPAEITSVSDIIMFNAFSFWEGADINNAANIFISHYNALKQQFPGRQIWVGETGWPYSGATQAAAVPNLANAHKYANDVVCWANANGVPYFYFEAFDEPWKNSQDNGAIEVSFGLFKADRTQHYLPQCGNAPTGNTPSTQAPTPTASSADCTAMFAQTTCRTASEDPSQVDQQAVANARGWLCANYPQYCSDIQAGGKYSSCNSVEQLSNAMSKYYNAFQSQGNSACDFGGVGRVAGSSTPTPTPSSSNTPSSNTPSTQVSQSMPPAATTSNNNGNCQTMFSQTTCRTASEDPSQVDQQAVADARGWLCSTYPQYCSNIVSGGQYSSCNSVEQLSNAMSLYYNDNKATQGDQACNFGGLGRVAGTVANPNNQQAPTPASSTVTPSSPANNNNNAPSQGNCGAGLYSCGQACYSPEQYCCPNGVLTQKQFC